MDTETLKERAEIFLKYDKRIFVRCSNGNFYFADILTVGEDFLYIYNFSGKRKGEKSEILWMDIEEILEYREDTQNV